MLLALVALAVLLAALFVPTFMGIAILFIVTLSVWEDSHLIALLCAVLILAMISAPFVRPGARAWRFPAFFGVALVVSALCAALYSFPVANDLSNMLFHPCGLIFFAGGGLLCIMEGVYLKSQPVPPPIRATGDHPITDIVIHHIARFGEPLDTQIRQLGELMSYHRLCDWFDGHWSLTAEQLQPLVAAKLKEALQDARERGWE
jgi:hypothetical protein